MKKYRLNFVAASHLAARCQGSPAYRGTWFPMSINNLGAVNWSLPWNFRCDGVARPPGTGGQIFYHGLGQPCIRTGQKVYIQRSLQKYQQLLAFKSLRTALVHRRFPIPTPMNPRACGIKQADLRPYGRLPPALTQQMRQPSLPYLFDAFGAARPF